MTAIVSFFVDGLPETKGSWRAIGGGRMKRDNPREKAWSTAVGWAAKAQMVKTGSPRPYDGHVVVEATFLLPPPKGNKNRRDVDKLARSVLDAMTGIVYVDDELVVDLHAIKSVTRTGMHGVQLKVSRALRVNYGLGE